MRSLLLALLAFSVPAAACDSSTMQVKTSDKSASDVARYRTYMHETAQQAPEGFTPSALEGEITAKVIADVDADLAKKGYSLANDGQLIVRIAAGRRVVARQPTGSAALAGAPAVKETEGELVIDMFDRASGAQVFHGFAHDVVSPGKLDEGKLSEAVTKILAPIPASAPPP